VLCLGRGAKKEYVPSPLARQYFESMHDFIEVGRLLSPRFEYSERVNAFINCCNSMGLLSGSECLAWININFDPQKIEPRFGGVPAAELFNMLVTAIRNDWKINNLQAKVNARKKEARIRCDEYCNYADSLFDNGHNNGCARLVVLRIDLYYEKRYADSKSVFDITKDLDHLIENKRGNSLFDSMKGYIAKLEYGVGKGVHWHVILFFDGSVRKNSSHIDLAEDIGHYWIDTITNGLGDFWNANKNADQYDKLVRRGIGVINWYETELRNNLKEFVIGYLCKVDQFIKPKWGPKVRLFRRGLSPKKRINKLGRPRKALESYNPHDQI